jgi:hypothetical protein
MCECNETREEKNEVYLRLISKERNDFFESGSRVDGEKVSRKIPFHLRSKQVRLCCRIFYELDRNFMI